ncbi:hypothetical protein K502DRAFT_364514 [Neoconidiobolus thromboides FSU 785]|nr:hypothetical protein K502DRAFT_364514 [Neoconidiobolus thromboides FSU 785]
MGLVEWVKDKYMYLNSDVGKYTKRRTGASDFNSRSSQYYEKNYKDGTYLNLNKNKVYAKDDQGINKKGTKNKTIYDFDSFGRWLLKTNPKVLGWTQGLALNYVEIVTQDLTSIFSLTKIFHYIANPTTNNHQDPTNFPSWRTQSAQSVIIRDFFVISGNSWSNFLNPVVFSKLVTEKLDSTPKLFPFSKVTDFFSYLIRA